MLRYVAASGIDVVGDWMRNLRDPQARARIAVRLARLTTGNFGDCKPLREGVWELRIDCGPGYRVYYAIAGRTRILLLCGGDKRKQSSDIEKAVRFWNDYKRRTTES